jgi:hypothetical protein
LTVALLAVDVPLPAGAGVPFEDSAVAAAPPDSGDPVSGEPVRSLPSVPEQEAPSAAQVGRPAVWAPQSTAQPVDGVEVSADTRTDVVESAGLPEREDLRSATRRVFERPDGLLQVEESSVPVNYQGADGVWREIDNRLVADGRGGFVNVANAFRVEFKAMGPGGGVRISADDGEVSFYARNAAAVRPVLAKDGLSVTYPNVLPGSDLVYEHPPVGRTLRIGGSPCPTARSGGREDRRSIRPSSNVTRSRWSSTRGAASLMLPGRWG